MPLQRGATTLSLGELDPESLRQPSSTSSAGGPVYEYRGAVIYSNEKGANYTFKLEGFPHGRQGYWGGLGHIDVVVDLVDAWLDTGRLPPPYVNKG